MLRAGNQPQPPHELESGLQVPLAAPKRLQAELPRAFPQHRVDGSFAAMNSAIRIAVSGRDVELAASKTGLAARAEPNG